MHLYNLKRAPVRCYIDLALPQDGISSLTSKVDSINLKAYALVKETILQHILLTYLYQVLRNSQTWTIDIKYRVLNLPNLITIFKGKN